MYLRTLKNFFAIVCLFTLLLTTSSLSYYYWLEEKVHEHKIFALIDAGELDQNFAKDSAHQIRLILKEKDMLPEGYLWEEAGREFSHKGTFYDIISFNKTSAGWELVAVSDEEESEIVAKQSKHSNYPLFKLSKKQLTFIAPVHDYPSQIFKQVLPKFIHYKVQLVQLTILKFSPPPDYI